MAAVIGMAAASLMRIETIDYRLLASLSTKRKEPRPIPSQGVADGRRACRHILGVSRAMVCWTWRMELNLKSCARRIRPWTFILEGDLSLVSCSARQPDDPQAIGFFKAHHDCNMPICYRSSMIRLTR